MQERLTFRAPNDLKNRLESTLEYGDSRSEFIREAIEEKLDRETEGSE
jgi:metal-responsive CopG/Arc/MetJ family transcriptional regulator